VIWRTKGKEKVAWGGWFAFFSRLAGRGGGKGGGAQEIEDDMISPGPTRGVRLLSLMCYETSFITASPPLISPRLKTNAHDRPSTRSVPPAPRPTLPGGGGGTDPPCWARYCAMTLSSTTTGPCRGGYSPPCVGYMTMGDGAEGWDGGCADCAIVYAIWAAGIVD
jgi:hypothetical protein